MTAILWAAIVLQAQRAAAFSLSDYDGGFELGQWQGYLEGAYEIDDQNTSGANGVQIDVLRNRFDERFDLENRGFYLLDPRLISGHAGLLLDFLQEQDRFSGQSLHQNQILLGYDFEGTLLPQEPYTLTLFANRQQSETNLPFSGTLDLTSQRFGAVARVADAALRPFGIYYLNSTLEAEQEETDEKTTMFGSTFKFDETMDTVNYWADKGYQTSDLRLGYEFAKVRDTGNANIGFQTNQADAEYNLDFGPTLNREWESEVQYFSFGGEGSNSYVFTNQTLRIDHYQSLSSFYRYMFSRVETDFGNTTTQYGSLDLQHRLYKSLVTDLMLYGSLTNEPQGTITVYGGQLSPSYQHSLPGGGSFFVNGGGRYEIDDNSLTSSQIHVVDEPHSAPQLLSLSTGFTLNNPFVILSTIVVVDNRGGARIPTKLGVDYEVLEVGNLAQIIVLPTSLIIQPGDPLLVTYTYQVAPSLKYSEVEDWLGVGVTFPWGDLSYLRQDAKPTVISGQANGLLMSLDSDMVQFDLHHDWGPVEAMGNVIWQDFDETGLAYTSWGFNQYLFYRPRYDWVFGLTGNESFIDYTLPARRARSYAARFTLDHYGSERGFFSLFAGLMSVTDTEVPTNTLAEAGLRAVFTLGKLRVSPIFTLSQREWGVVSTRDLDFRITITRSF